MASQPIKNISLPASTPPDKFSVDIAEQILGSIEHGLPPSRAASLWLVHPAMLKDWIDDIPEFAIRILRAESRHISRTLSKISKSGASWRTHAWKLERRYPTLFHSNYLPTHHDDLPDSDSIFPPCHTIDKEMCDRLAIEWQEFEKKRFQEENKVLAG